MHGADKCQIDQIAPVAADELGTAQSGLYIFQTPIGVQDTFRGVIGQGVVNHFHIFDTGGRCPIDTVGNVNQQFPVLAAGTL